MTDWAAEAVTRGDSLIFVGLPLLYWLLFGHKAPDPH